MELQHQPALEQCGDVISCLFSLQQPTKLLVPPSIEVILAAHASGTARGFRASSIATKVKCASVTFCIVSP